MQEVMSANMKIVAILLCCLPIFSESSCPEPCICRELHSSCRNSSLTEIIDNINPETNSLDYSYNKLSEIPNNIFATKGIVKLEDLNLDWNLDVKLHPDSFKGLLQLRWLYIAGDNVRNLNPDQLKYNPIVEKLVMFNNVITLPTEGPLLNSLSLKELWLGACDILSVPAQVFSGVPNLEVLDLSHNYIQVLRQRLFENLRNLKRLYLNDNRLKIIQPQTFVPITKIEVINFNNNKLRTMQIEIIRDKQNLRELTLGENPLDCDCRLFQTWWTLSLKGVNTGDAKCTLGNETLDDAYQDNSCEEPDDRIGVVLSGNKKTTTTTTTTTTEAQGSCVFWGDEGCR